MLCLHGLCRLAGVCSTERLAPVRNLTMFLLDELALPLLRVIHEVSNSTEESSTSKVGNRTYITIIHPGMSTHRVHS